MQLRMVFVLIGIMVSLSACVVEPYGRGGGYEHGGYEHGGGGHDDGRRVWRN